MEILATYYSNTWCIRLQNIQVFLSSLFITIDDGNFLNYFAIYIIQKTNSCIDSFILFILFYIGITSFMNTYGHFDCLDRV